MKLRIYNEKGDICYIHYFRGVSMQRACDTALSIAEEMAPRFCKWFTKLEVVSKKETREVDFPKWAYPDE